MPQGALEALSEKGREGHPSQGCRRGHLVTDSSGQAEHALTIFVCAHEIARHHVDVRAGLVDRHHGRRRRRLAEVNRHVECLLVESQSLAGGEALRGLLAGLHQITERPRPVLRFRKVVSEHLVLIGQAVCVELLDGQRDEVMEVLAPLDEERVVGDVVSERVLEHVRQLGEQALLVDELDSLELAQELLVLTPDVADTVEEAARELPADHRRELERLLGRFRQSIDARHDDVLDRVGNDDALEQGGEDVAAALQPDGADLLERLHDFFDEEGIALGLLGDESLERVGETLGRKHAPSHLGAGLGRERGQGQARVVRPVPEWRNVSCTVGQNHQDPARRDDVGHEPQVLFGGLVHPVDVFVDDDLRPDLGCAEQQASHRFEHLGPAELRFHRLNRRVTGIYGQEMPEVRQRGAEVRAEAQDGALDLLDDRGVLI